MITSLAGINLIKSWESFMPSPYYCPAGVLSIGYGHAINGFTEKFDQPITVSDAEQLLIQDIRATETTINTLVKVVLSQSQFDALCSLVYNWGSGKFLRSNGLKILNSLNYAGAAMEFFSRERGVVNIAGKFSQGLYNRRQAELKLWNDKT